MPAWTQKTFQGWALAACVFLAACGGSGSDKKDSVGSDETDRVEDFVGGGTLIFTRSERPVEEDSEETGVGSGLPEEAPEEASENTEEPEGPEPVLTEREVPADVMALNIRGSLSVSVGQVTHGEVIPLPQETTDGLLTGARAWIDGSSAVMLRLSDLTTRSVSVGDRLCELLPLPDRDTAPLRVIARLENAEGSCDPELTNLAVVDFDAQRLVALPAYARDVIPWKVDGQIEALITRNEQSAEVVLLDPDSGAVIRGLGNIADENLQAVQVEGEAPLLRLGTTLRQLASDQDLLAGNTGLVVAEGLANGGGMDPVAAFGRAYFVSGPRIFIYDYAAGDARLQIDLSVREINNSRIAEITGVYPGEFYTFVRVRTNEDVFFVLSVERESLQYRIMGTDYGRAIGFVDGNFYFNQYYEDVRDTRVKEQRVVATVVSGTDRVLFEEDDTVWLQAGSERLGGEARFLLLRGETTRVNDVLVTNASIEERHPQTFELLREFGSIEGLYDDIQTAAFSEQAVALSSLEKDSAADLYAIDLNPENTDSELTVLDASDDHDSLVTQP